MRVYLVARKLKTKSKDVIEKLATLNLDVAPNSKIDKETAKKAKLLIKQPVRVEELANELDLSVEKLLKKLMEMNIDSISHLSILKEKDLIRILKLKTLENLKKKPKVKKVVKAKKSKDKKPKLIQRKKRVFEVANELGIAEAALLKKLRQMNILALHRRSPLDEEIIEKLKEQNYTFKEKFQHFIMHTIERAPDYLESSKDIFSNPIFFSVIIILLGIMVSSNILVAKGNLDKQKMYQIKGEAISQPEESMQILETIALLEIKKQKTKIPIVEEGKDKSPIVDVLTHKSTTVMPGKEGKSVLVDAKSGKVSEKFIDVKASDILYITNLEAENFYYRVLSGKEIRDPKKNSYNSTIEFQLANNRKIVAVLQKIE